MDNSKSFEEYRAEQLGYIYFSRLKNLIIQEARTDSRLFDYLIDISENEHSTGRFFGVEVKDYATLHSIDQFWSYYSSVSIPSLLVLFDNKTDRGFYQWIKKPKADGQLEFEKPAGQVAELNNDSLRSIVNEIKDWYVQRNAA